MLTAEEIELFAAAVHDAWMRENRKHGITSRLSSLTGEEQMVEYCELSDPIQEYDRAMVRTFLAVCEANGYAVRKRMMLADLPHRPPTVFLSDRAFEDEEDDPNG